jgi:hypothetical protein
MEDQAIFDLIDDLAADVWGLLTPSLVDQDGLQLLVVLRHGEDTG